MTDLPTQEDIDKIYIKTINGLITKHNESKEFNLGLNPLIDNHKCCDCNKWYQRAFIWYQGWVEYFQEGKND